MGLAWKYPLYAFLVVVVALHFKYFLSHPQVPFMGKVAHALLKLQAMPWCPLFLHRLIPRVGPYDDGYVSSSDVQFTRTGDAHIYEFRVFVPRNETRNSDVMVWVHGGGFLLGHPSEKHIDGTCRAMARLSGVRFISLNYRKAPDFHYLQGFHDIDATLSWISSSMPHVKRIGLGGDSAGATLSLSSAIYQSHNLSHLLLVYPGLHLGEDPEMRDAWILPQDVRALFKAYHDPPTNAEDAERYHFFRELLVDLDDDAHHHLLQRLPKKTHIISAGNDPLHPSSSRLEAKLRKAQCHVEHTLYPEAVHGFFCQEEYPDRDDALYEAARSIRDSFSD